MANRIHLLIVASASSALVAVLMLFAQAEAGELSSASTFRRMRAPRSTPTILAVSPSQSPNNLDTTIRITGTGFQAPVTVTLNSAVLPSSYWIDSTLLTTTVPWGLNPGVYTVTVKNADGGIGSLTDAFTVSQAIGVWTSGGPYGGQVQSLAVHPDISTTVYAFAGNVGLFKSTDGGGSWSLILPSPYLPGDQHVVLKPGAPDTLLAGDRSGLYKSGNGGIDWQQIISGSVRAVAFAPSEASRIYATVGNQMHVSIDNGDNWLTRTLTVGNNLSAIAVHPVTPTIGYAGADNGHIFKTVDGGDTWQDLNTGFPYESILTLAIDPLVPDRVFVSGPYAFHIFHRSLDGGLHWEPMTAYMNPGNIVNDYAFDQTTPGKIYGVTCHYLRQSVDGGTTWTNLATLSDCGLSLELDPATNVPLYSGGTSQGVQRSDDAGATWYVASQGMTALETWSIAASAVAPEQLYAAASYAGGFASRDAGQSWIAAITNPGDYVMAAAADPTQPCVGFLAGGSVYKTTDCGASWTSPWTFDGNVLALAVDPHDPNRVFAAGSKSYPDQIYVGKIFRSTTAGASWQEVTPSFPISRGLSIVVDPIISGTLYVGTGEGTMRGKAGLYKSIDGGTTWITDTKGIPTTGVREVRAMAIHPTNSNILYAMVTDGGSLKGGLFRRTDPTGNWTRLQQYRFGAPMAIDPLSPHTLYWGKQGDPADPQSTGGLWQSTDGGVTFTRAAGSFGYASIYCLSIASASDRTILYVGTPGGQTSGGAGLAAKRAAAGQILGGGVYQQTIDHRISEWKNYLPLIKK